MKNLIYTFLLTTICSLTITEGAKSAALYEKNVFCGTEECGTMEISTYKAFEKLVEGTKFGGVTIDGAFNPKKKCKISLYSVGNC